MPAAAETQTLQRLPCSNQVLIVDDDVLVRRSASRVLERVGYQVVHAHDASSACAIMEREDVSVVLLDVDLPDRSGIELLQQFRREERDVGVVMLTGSSAREHMEAAIRSGACGYLIKPLVGLTLEAQVGAAHLSVTAKRAEARRYSMLQAQLGQTSALLEKLPRSLAQSLSFAWELRHVETGSHVRRIAAYSEIIALALGYSETDAATLGHVAMLHDLGKIAIPDAILTKPDRLTAQEFEIMRHHTVAGARMLAGVGHPFLDRAATIALHHHERWDGSGYPDNLQGEQCPLDARIVAVVDVYDALGQDRCYKRGWSKEEITAYFERTAGILFETRIVEALFAQRARLQSVAAELPDAESSGTLRVADRLTSHQG
jgi:putative two-component system response regulator